MTKTDPAPAAPQPFVRNRIARGLFAFTLGQQQRCPFCHDHLNEGEALVACSACRAVYHRECLGPEGECLTFGCPHAPPAPRRSSLRDRWSRREPGSRGTKAAALGLLLTGLALAWLFVHPPHPRPIDPPYHPPHHDDHRVIPLVSSVVHEPREGLVVREGEPVRVRGEVVLSAGGGASYPRSIPVSVPGTLPLQSARVRDDLRFACELNLPPGTHRVALEVPHGTITRLVVRRVVVRPRGPLAPQLDLVGTVSGSEVMVRGKLRGQGPVDVTIRGGGQSLTYQAQAPGPFATVLTLPHVGAHSIQVAVRDAQGRVRTATGTVRRVK